MAPRIASERGLDRLVFFTDAVVAIAITLLILPLVDSVPEAAAEHSTSLEFLQDNSSQLLGFVVSFLVIARLWRAHHSIFRHVRAHTPAILYLSTGWAFTIAVLPLPTALIAELDQDRLSTGLYIGTMTISSFLLTSILWIVSRNSDIADPDYPVTPSTVGASAATSLLFVIALVVGLATVSLWPLLLLLLTGPVVSAGTRISARRQKTGR